MPQAADPTAAFTLSHTVGAFKFRRWDCTNSGQRKRSRAPVRSRHVPLSRPQPPQTAAKVRGFSPTAPGFAAETDSPLEERVMSEPVSIPWLLGKIQGISAESRRRAFEPLATSKTYQLNSLARKQGVSRSRAANCCSTSG